jgi:C4-dicarboxylate transporter DctQ subunit
MKTILNLLDLFINNISKYIAVIGISTGVSLTFINVVARYIFNHSITWASELSVYMFLWGIFFGSVYCFKENSHISIGILVESINKKIAKQIMIFTNIITFAFLVAVAYYGYGYLELVIDLEETSIDLEIPMWIPYLVIPVSFAFSAYVVLIALSKLIKTPYNEIVFHSELKDIMKVTKPIDSTINNVNSEEILKQAHKKSGGLV